jgi:hypothetical protein
MLTHTGVLDSPLTLASDCVVRDCSKPTFMGYYVCAEHFVFYAAPRYTESMVIKAEPIGVWCIYPEATCSSSYQREHTEPEPAECDTAREARIA